MRNIFHKTSVQLTLVYLAIIATIGLFFSASLYHATVQELNRDFQRTVDVVRHSPNFVMLPVSYREKYLKERAHEIDLAKASLLGRLLITNVVILAGAGFVSYYLARRTLRPIEEAHEAQARFTADASHELRTPIAAMQTEIEVALMNPNLNLADAKKQLRSNLEELARLTALSEGLLRLAQLESKDILREPVEIKSLIQHAVQRMEPLADIKGIKITSKLAKEELRVIGDESSLSEVLTILIDNAIKYSKKNSEINIRAIRHQRVIDIAIQDHGPGITSDSLSHIFDRFYRADQARKSGENGGYGLGLAIAKNIIDLHGGSIQAASKLDKGTTFTIKLPV